jgi:hypothetical protein
MIDDGNHDINSLAQKFSLTNRAMKEHLQAIAKNPDFMNDIYTGGKVLNRYPKIIEQTLLKRAGSQSGPSTGRR